MTPAAILTRILLVAALIAGVYAAWRHYEGLVGDLADARNDLARTEKALEVAIDAATAPGAADPDRVCFNRPELEREIRVALEAFRASARGLVDEGSAARLKLDTAIRWAQERRPE